jgi:hypothetical protein
VSAVGCSCHVLSESRPGPRSGTTWVQCMDSGQQVCKSEGHRLRLTSEKASCEAEQCVVITSLLNLDVNGSMWMEMAQRGYKNRLDEARLEVGARGDFADGVGDVVDDLTENVAVA